MFAMEKINMVKKMLLNKEHKQTNPKENEKKNKPKGKIVKLSTHFPFVS